jgi:hypothetical protein
MTLSLNIIGLSPGITINGVNYTNARMNSNGWLALYSGTAPTATQNYSALSTAMTGGNVILAPMAADLNTNAGSQAYRLSSGGVHTFEWVDFRRFGSASGTESLNFQVILNTNDNTIQFAYGNSVIGAGSTTNFQVGWKTNGQTATNWTTDINNLMLDIIGSPNSCTWENAVTGNANTSTTYFNAANNGVIPPNGLTLTWTPQAGPAPVRTFQAISGITADGATINFTAPAGASEYNVRYRAVGACTWTNAAGNPFSTNAINLTGLSSATTYQIQVQSSDGTLHGLWSHIPNQAGTGSGYNATGTFTTLPVGCSGIPASSNTLTSASQVCPTTNFTLSLSNTYTESGITYQWQSADDVAFTTNVVNLGTAATQATTQSTNKWYRCVITCTNTSDFTESTPVEVLMNLSICNPAPFYPLTTNVGTYNSIAATGTPVAILGDNVVTNITGLNPGITINGVNYSNARVSSNGWLMLYGATAPTATTEGGVLSTAHTNAGIVLAPMNADLNTNPGSQAYRLSSGGIHIFEWVDFRRFGSAIGTESLNFQVILNTNNNTIQFAYGNSVIGAGSTTNFQVGWKTNGQTATNWTTDINNLMLDVTGSPNSCNWQNAVTGNANTSTTYFNAANNGVIPPNGLTLTWTPQAGPAPVRTFQAISGITADGATINFTAPAGASEYNVRYRAVGACTWTNAAGNPFSTNAIDLTGLSSGTTYQIQVQSSDGALSGLWSHIPNQVGTGSGYTATGTFTTLQLPCSGNPAASDALSSAPSVCSGVNFTLSVNTAYSESGITFQWQSSPDGMSYTDITGANAATLNTSQTSETWYQLVITCTNSGLSTTSTPVQVLMSPFFDCYCTPSYTFGKTDGDLISNVEIAGTTLSNNTGTAQTNPAYTYFPPNPPTNTTTAELSAGTTYSVNISVGTWGNQHVRVWIDYNQDGIFSPTESVGSAVIAPGQANTGPFPPASFNISLACNPPVGTYRMRVRSVWSTTSNFHLTLDPCANYGYGETEDYDITILPPPPCPAPTALSATPGTTSASVSWTAGCTENEWIVEYGATGFTPGTGTSVSGITSIPYTITGLDGGTTYDVYVYADCDANGISNAAGPVTFTTTPPNDLCADAIPLTLACNTTTTVSGNTANATNTGNGPACFTTASTAPGLWYTFQGTGGNVEVSLCGSSFDTKLYVYDGTCGALTCVAGNDDFCGSQSQVSFNAASSITYYVLVTGSGSSSGDFVLSITPQALVATAAATSIDCHSGTSTVTVTAIGGIFPYTGTGTFIESAGTYSYVVEDATGCQATADIVITQPDPLVIDISSTVVVCNGDQAVVTVTGSGGTAPYTGEGSFTVSPGSYNYTVFDDNGCSILGGITVSNPDPIVVTASPNDASCFGSADGTIDLNITGGYSPYDVSWDNGDNGTSIGGLIAGSYEYTLVDDEGCSTTGTVSVNQPTQLSVSFTGIDNNCFGGSDGEIDLDVLGGTAPYSYMWNNGETTQDITGLSAGNYEVTVTDDHGCEIIDNFDINQGDEIVITVDAILDASNCVTGDGEIMLTVTGGDGNFTYDWDNGATSEDITGLTAGDYNLAIEDGLGCIASFSTSITQPIGATVSLLDANDPLCFGDDNGTITIDVTGGSAPYDFFWSNNETTQNIADLVAGNYEVLVTDDLGCESSLTIILTEPDPIVITGTAIDANCHNSTDGEVSINITGGTISTDYQYDWSDGAAFSANSKDISGVPAGIYAVIVTDDNGCSATETFNVDAPTQISASANITDELLGNDGAIDITVSGGTAPYTFVWSNSATTEDISGLTEGPYSVVVTDANGCSETFNYNVGSSVGLTSSTGSWNVTVYPNPSNGFFFVEIDDFNISATNVIVRDALGRIAVQLAPNGNKFTVDLSQLVNGTYFMEINSNNSRVVKTVLIQK